MRRTNWMLLLHPAFLCCLLILVLNDHWWKYSSPGWLTGKLSDFTGLFVFTVFLIVLMPRKKLLVASITCLAFIWWKSPLSESFIYWCNHYLHFPVQRVVDYNDLWALLVIPAACFIKPININLTVTGKRFLKPFMFCSTIAAICADEPPYRFGNYSYPDNHMFLNEGYKTRLPEEAILHKLDSLGIQYRVDSVEMLPVRASNYYYFKVSHPGDTAVQWAPLSNLKDSSLYFRRVSTPFYIIPSLVLEKDTISNIIWRFSTGKRKNNIEVVSAELPPSMDYNWHMMQYLQKKYGSLIKEVLKN